MAVWECWSAPPRPPVLPACLAWVGRCARAPPVRCIRDVSGIHGGVAHTHATLLVFASEFAQLAVNAVYMVNRSSVEQAVTPPSLRGRVQASRIAAHAASGTLGILLGGILGEQFGMNAAILVGVVGGLFSFVWLWRSPVRGLDAFPHPTQ